MLISAMRLPQCARPMSSVDPPSSNRVTKKFPGGGAGGIPAFN
jgi:hypothetical protein